jgi:MFS family permease
VNVLINGVMFLLAGWLSDKFGSKRVIVIGACVTAAGMVLLGFVKTPWTYFVIWGFTGAGGTLGFTLAIDTLLTNWFVRKRGLAFSVRFAVMGLVSALVLPLISWLISSQGWRNAVQFWGVVVFMCVPFLLYYVRQEHPEFYGLLPDGDDKKLDIDKDVQVYVQEEDFTIKEIIRNKTYWVLFIAGVLFRAILQGINIHIIPLLIDRGIDPVAAGGLLAITSLFMIPSRAFGGIIADRVEKKYLRFIITGLLLLLALGIGIYLLVPGMVGVYIFLALWGFGSGSFIPLDLVLRSRYFGRKTFGQQTGISSMLSAPMTFIAPIYTGWMFDITGTYNTPFTVFAVLAVISSITMCLAKIPSRQLHNVGE